MKKALSLILCLLMLTALVLTACTPSSGDESKADGSVAPSQSGESSGTEDADSPYYDEDNDVYHLPDSMPEFDFEQKTFTIGVTNEQGESTYYNEDVLPRENTDEAIRAALEERNNVILERYGVEIKTYDTEKIADDIREVALTGEDLFDAAMPFMSAAALLAADNKLQDLNNFSDYLHFDAPWWEDTATETATIKGKTFFTTGDISIMPKIVSFSIVFNKGMLNDIDSTADLYQEVRDGTWTFDRLVELSRMAASNNIGTTGDDPNATWGLSSSITDPRAYYVAAGQNFCTINASGVPQISIGSDRSVTVAQKLLQTYADYQSWGCYICNNDNGKVTNIWATSLDVFGEGRCLFRTNAFSAVKKLRSYTKGVEFGILPLPKYEEAQDEYYTFTNPDYATCIVIPANVKNPEFSAYMIEVLACESKNYLTDAYYEVVLKDRDSKDSESEEMLDNYVFKNIVYDVGIVYNFNSIGTVLTTLTSSGSTDIASTLASSKDATQTAIDQLIANYGG